MNRFHVYMDRAGGYRWRLIAANGEIVAVSESYTTLYSAQRSANKVKQLATVALVTQY